MRNIVSITSCNASQVIEVSNENFEKTQQPKQVIKGKKINKTKCQVQLSRAGERVTRMNDAAGKERALHADTAQEHVATEEVKDTYTNLCIHFTHPVHCPCLLHIIIIKL